MAVQTRSEQGIMWKRTHEASTLHKELQATQKYGEWEKQFSSGENTSITYPILNGQP